LKVLFDTNIVLDHLLDRAPHSLLAAEFFSAVERNRISGYLCATTVTTVYYLAYKVMGSENAGIAINKLLELFEVAAVNRVVLESSLNLGLPDYEDAVLHQSAIHAGADAIVTRNAKDFKNASLTIYSPPELMALLGG
jgi:predicted nucleic acid-binding protein